jgi:hypothetical protein
MALATFGASGLAAFGCGAGAVGVGVGTFTDAGAVGIGGGSLAFLVEGFDSEPPVAAFGAKSFSACFTASVDRSIVGIPVG